MIAQEGSISKATHQLHLAQPTLSTQLKQFEDFLNVQLFIRENRKLVLTEEGHRVLSYAKMIFDIGQELKDRMVDLSPKGRVRLQIGITNFVPKTIVEIMLDYILKIEPTVYIQLEKGNMEELIQNLDDHIIDIVLTDTPFETSLSSEITSKYIGKIPIIFCAHPRIAKQVKKFPEDMDGKPLILPAAPRQIAYSIKEYLYEHQVKPHIIGEIQDIEVVRRLALRGYGIAAINLLTIKEAPAKQKLEILNQNSKHTIFEKVYLITKKRKIPHPLLEKVQMNFRVDIPLS
ncbi:MAG: LysR family transcriptional regulator [Candidatus Omnitrophica bacterium]|nr:LysR family transcriptional regulator [Candidatus Omnitrophota bacterium]